MITDIHTPFSPRVETALYAGSMGYVLDMKSISE